MSATLHVSAVFWTLQGEGAWTGRPCVFVRLAGCNLWDGEPEHRHLGRGACARWCDASFAHGERMNVEELVEAVERSWGLWDGRTDGTMLRRVVLTGGEPTLQRKGVRELGAALIARGFSMAVETNGTVPIELFVAGWGHLQWVTVSPKLGAELVVWEASELKVVLPGEVDGPGWSDEMLLSLEARGRWGALFVQPMDPVCPTSVETSFLQPFGAGGGVADDAPRPVGESDRYVASVRRCVEFARMHPTWRVSCQAHKFLGLP